MATKARALAGRTRRRVVADADARAAGAAERSMKHAVKHIHFVGIGGAGMSGIAEILHNLGYTISGSDLATAPTTRRLAALGVAHLHRPRRRQHRGRRRGGDVDRGAGRQPRGHRRARAARIPVVPRAVMLAELMRLKQGIAIAGTHGKTTTTSLVASVLAEAGLDPTFVIGGRLKAAGANSRLGAGDYIVVEADESRRVVPEPDAGDGGGHQHRRRPHGHLRPRLRPAQGAFVEFMHRMPFYGAAVLCIDDPGVREIMPMISRPVTTYGFGADAQVRAIDVQAHAGHDVLHGAAPRRRAHARPGHHAEPARRTQRAQRAGGDRGRDRAELPDAPASRAWPSSTASTGASQRRRHAGGANGGGSFTLIDDYGHHPVEMAATLAAARGAYPGHRIVLAFQPHRYTRTRDCFEDFVKVLGTADAVLLAEVYAAGEAPIVAADGRSLARAVRVAGKVEPVFVEDIADDAAGDRRAFARDGDVVIAMGAGSIGAVPAKVAELFGGDRAGAGIDVKSFGKVAVLMGGTSAEREVSLMSGTGVLAALQAHGVDAHAVRPRRARPRRAEREGFDALLHRAARPLRRRRHRAGRARTARHSLHRRGLMASAMAMDKIMTKRVWIAEGLPTPRYVRLRATQQARETWAPCPTSSACR